MMNPPPRTFTIRWFMGWIGMIIGAWVGWNLADFGWGVLNPRGVWVHGPPPTPIGFWLMKFIWSICGGVLGLALARWRDLPSGQRDEDKMLE
jgi:hypothetical protein